MPDIQNLNLIPDALLSAADSVEVYDSGTGKTFRSTLTQISAFIGAGASGITATTGALLKAGSTTTGVDSIITESGTVITIGGTLVITGTTLTIRGVAYTWPAADGSSTYVLTTNGSGTLSWAAQTGGSGTIQTGADGYLAYYAGAGTTLNDTTFLSVAATTLTVAGTLAATTLTGAGSGITALDASNIASGTVPPANLGSGASITTKFLRGDSTWQTISGGGDALVANPLSQFAATTSAQLAGVVSDETGTGALVFGTGPTITINASCINAGTVATARLGSGTASSATFLRGDGTWTATPASGNITINTPTASYTLVIGDLGKLVRMNVASANNLTVPPNSSVAFAVGDTIMVQQMGAGATTLVAGSGVTLDRVGHTTLTLSGQFAVATLIKTATDTWEVVGGLTSTDIVSATGTIASTNLPIDYSTARSFEISLNGTLSTITITNYPATGTEASVMLWFTADGTARTITWSVNGVTAKWDGGTAPTPPSVSGRIMGVQLLTKDAWATVRALLVAQSIQ